MVMSRKVLVSGVFFSMLALCVWRGAAWGDRMDVATVVSSANAVESPSAIPAGTILPVRLEKTLSLKDARRGQLIETKIAQEVPLPDGEKIPMKSLVIGSLVSLQNDTDGPGAKLTLKFDRVEEHKQTLQITTYLRAIASFRAVQSAQIPHAGADMGSPGGWSDTVQIGGDIRFGDGGEVRNRAKQKVGKGVIGGVLVHISANPALGCEGPASGNDYPQALWVFSSDACGLYDLKDVKVAHAGKGDPIGEITLHFEKEGMRLEGGAAMLLRVVAEP
jgi:hypothetical protein